LRKYSRSQWLVALLALGLLLSLIVYPIVQVPVKAGLRDGWIEPYVRLFKDPNFYRLWGRSLMIGASAAGIAVAGGFGLGWLVVRTNVPFRNLFGYLIILPYLTSMLITAFGFATMGSPSAGWMNDLFASIGLPFRVDFYSIWGIALVLGVSNVPIAFLVMRNQLSSAGRDEEEAAQVSGATTLRILGSVTIPLLRPAIGAAALLVFAMSLANFSVAAVLGSAVRIDVVPTKIYIAASQYPADWGTAAVYAMTLITFLLLIIAAQLIFESRAKVASASTSMKAPSIIELGPVARHAGAAALMGYVLIAFVLPIASVFVISFLPYWGAPFSELTLDTYRFVFADPIIRMAIRNTLIIASVAATIATLVGGMFAYAVARFSLPFGKILSAFASSPLGLPGLIIGLGYLFAYVGTPLYGTLWLPALALLSRFMPFALRTVSANLAGVHRSQEEAARVSGAGELRILIRVIIPQVWPAFVGAWAVLFLIFTREVDSVVLLGGSAHIISVELYNMWRDSFIAEAAAVSVLLLAITGLVMVLLVRVMRKTGGSGLNLS